MARWTLPRGSRRTWTASWHTFDPRNNVPRIGRILIARGRDATDVAISNAFGPNTLVGFKVWADEISERPPLDRRHAPAHGAARHGLSLLDTGETRRTSDDVSPAREPRSAARASEARHPSRAPPSLRWLHDVFDNSVAIATFGEPDRWSCASTAPSRWSISKPRCPTTRSRSRRKPIRSATPMMMRPIWCGR